MSFVGTLPKFDEQRFAINRLYRADESECVAHLLDALSLTASQRQGIVEQAARWVTELRVEGAGTGGLDAFLQEYDLSSREGVMLMCLAEALLRIPDADTANHLIRDKLSDANWQAHLGDSGSLFVNASTWALMLTGRLVRLSDSDTHDLSSFLGRLVGRSGEPVIRQAVTQAMRILGRQFVMGRTIGEAVERAKSLEAKGYTYSYDMLGEAALTEADARRYLAHYHGAIETLGRAANGAGPIAGPGVSVKLSALHPRYELAEHARVQHELGGRLLDLARAAKQQDVSLCVDAEEADRLDMSLTLLEPLFKHPELRGWEGLGLAVQSYQKRGLAVVEWLAEKAHAAQRRLMVRLVKGAYWDTEIKRAQERGLDNYSVFTRKVNTDLSYLVCAQRLLESERAFYPQFATHNAHTIAAVLEMAQGRRDLEFQRLHGMGEMLYDPLVLKDHGGDIACRIYAPVGGHEELLAYLVRRLLENGANTSFVNRIVHEELAVEEIVADPVSKVMALSTIPHPKIPLPTALYGEERRNSSGIDLSDVAQLEQLAARMAANDISAREAGPVVAGRRKAGGTKATIVNPADTRQVVGTLAYATPPEIDEAFRRASGAMWEWDGRGGTARAECLERAADLLEANHAELMTLCVREAGKTLTDALAEIREAVDFCRYYALQARQHFDVPLQLTGPTGESNQLSLHGRGVFVCISPWNFPLAIFMGQVVAALAAGNAVLAKPAEQTSLIAVRAVELLHTAGVPSEVLALVPGDGEVGQQLISDVRTAGVAFTGSTETAHIIQQTLASREGAIVPLIAETGGQNVMLVDSSALPEQVVSDVITSAFRSAGQRCSALRILLLQEEVAPKIITMLGGAMEELNIGDPALLETDVGPVIDAAACDMLEAHAARMTKEGHVVRQLALPDSCGHGHFFAPMAVEIESIDQLEREVFGPILHIVRYQSGDLNAVLDAINATGYGLTFGIHTRIDARARSIHQRLRVGNTYINRNMIGATVGVQPFGGEGLSGTGPKAGGPHYLMRFATERTLTINTTAAGGNASLISLQDEQ